MFNSFSTLQPKSWFALYTKARHEKKVNEALAGKNLEAFLPLRNVINRWKDRKKEIQLPLFPGYLFVRMEPDDRFNVLNTRGVVRILGNKGNPMPVPVEEIEATKTLLESGLRYEPFSYLTEGKEVVVIRGPLEGVGGRILQVRGATRLIISVNLIQRSVSVEVDVSDIELA
ncbi:MAG: UpxY family transcription antiterminator [Thermodesulfobacteriota bacterium]